MNLPLKIALRYLVSKKRHGAVNVISGVSVAGVAVAAMAIVVVLSVYNGFTRLAQSHYSVIDPDIVVSPLKGKAMAGADSLALLLGSLPQVAAAAPTVAERGLLSAGNTQAAVWFKGVPEGYAGVVDYSEALQGGVPRLPQYLAPEQVYADFSVGVAIKLAQQPGVTSATLYVPRRTGRINPANPATGFFEATLVPAAVFAVDQADIDADHIYIPLATARRLLQYDSAEATAIEVKKAPGVSDADAVAAISRLVGDGYAIAPRDAQHPEAYRMIAIEKWVTFAMLVFIMLIAAFNIISTLSLMVIEKRDNMATLRFLGASRALDRRVFIWLGIAITMAGGIAGTAMGTVLALLQQHCGIIKLGGDPAQLAIDVYPVQVQGADLVAVLALTAVVSVAVSAVTLIFTKRLQ